MALTRTEIFGLVYGPHDRRAAFYAGLAGAARRVAGVRPSSARRTRSAADAAHHRRDANASGDTRRYRQQAAERRPQPAGPHQGRRTGQPHRSGAGARDRRLVQPVHRGRARDVSRNVPMHPAALEVVGAENFRRGKRADQPRRRRAGGSEACAGDAGHGRRQGCRRTVAGSRGDDRQTPAGVRQLPGQLRATGRHPLAGADRRVYRAGRGCVATWRVGTAGSSRRTGSPPCARRRRCSTASSWRSARRRCIR